MVPPPVSGLTFDEGVRLYNEADLHDLGAAAHARRLALHPHDSVTYVIDTTINYTNVCNVHCTFCAFFRPEHHKEGYTMSHDQVLGRVKYAVDQGATQIMIQGGVNPELGIEWFETALSACERRVSARRSALAFGLGDRRPRARRGHFYPRRPRSV